MNSPVPFESYPPLDALLSRLFADELSPEQSTELTSLLENDARARELYVLQMNLHGELMWRMSGARAAESPQVEPALVLAKRRRFPATARMSALAACLLLIGYFAGMSVLVSLRDQGKAELANDEERATGSSDATILNTADVEWSGSAEKSEIRNPKFEVAAGEPLSIQSGIVELQLKRGTTLLIEGPADWTIDGDNSATLTHGKLVARVPQQAIGFTLDTPTAKIVDLGTEFCVEVNKSSATEVHVLRGRVETTKLAADGTTPVEATPIRVEAGSAIRIEQGKSPAERIAFDMQRFKTSTSADGSQQEAFVGSIPLGNLFDDRQPFVLSKAVATDMFLAVPDSDHLGIDRVVSGGDAVRTIAPRIEFDLTNLGWGGKTFGSVVNDAWNTVQDSVVILGIRTEGKPPQATTGKIEDGIGMHANAILTFNLDEIRTAGGLAGKPLRFVCDRAGINDSILSRGRSDFSQSSVNMLVLVSSENGVTAGLLNGRSVEIKQANKVWRITRPASQPLRADGKFAEFEIDLVPGAKYLTLAVTDAGDGMSCDQAVWSGVRLELTDGGSSLNQTKRN